MACPFGGFCGGFNGTLKDANARYPYPIANPGFFNLNGSMASACPTGNAISGRDVCMVACPVQSACIGGNLCADGYVSIAPLFRCGSCAKGYYPANGKCIGCSNSPYAIVVVAVLVIIAASSAGYFLNKRNVNIAFLSIGIDFMQVRSICV